MEHDKNVLLFFFRNEFIKEKNVELFFLLDKHQKKLIK